MVKHKGEMKHDDDGSTYTGQYKGDKRWGYGVITWEDKSKYQGYWKDGKQEGQGIFTHPNGDYYKGEWMDGVPHGWGELLQITEYYKKA